MRWESVKVGLVCCIVFAVQVFFPAFTDLFLLTPDAFHQPWRFVTAIFLHGDFSHLLFNMIALVTFGLTIENLNSSRRFYWTFFVTGILANVVSVFFYPASLGASGAIFGLIGLLMITKPWYIVWAFGVPMPIAIAGIIWAAVDVFGIFVPSGVGNIAHLSGLGFGLILGLFLRKKK